MSKTIVRIPARTQVEIMHSTPSDVFLSAQWRGGAGIHQDQRGRYNKRDRAKNKHEERRALMGDMNDD